MPDNQPIKLTTCPACGSANIARDPFVEGCKATLRWEFSALSYGADCADAFTDQEASLKAPLIRPKK